MQKDEELLTEVVTVIVAMFAILVGASMNNGEPELGHITKRFEEHIVYIRSARCINYDSRRSSLKARDGNAVLLALRAVLRKDRMEGVRQLLLRDVLESNSELRGKILSGIFSEHAVDLQEDASLYLCSLDVKERQRLVSKLLEPPRREKVRALLIGLMRTQPQPLKLIQEFRGGF